MATSSSIGSLTSSIDSLASLYKQQLQSQSLAPLQSKQAKLNAQISAWATMKSKLKALYDTSSSMVLSQVARADRVSSSRFNDTTNTIVTSEFTPAELIAGTATRDFTITNGSGTAAVISLAVLAGDTNTQVLTKVANAVNANVSANPYVTASVEVAATGQSRLVLTSKGTGSSNTISLQDASGTLLGNIGLTSAVVTGRRAASLSEAADDPLHAPGGYSFAGVSTLLNASSSSQYAAFSATSSDTSVAVSAGPASSVGTHVVRVTQLAKSDTVITKQFVPAGTTLASAGTKRFTITNGSGTPIEVSVDILAPDTDSQVLTKVAAAINATLGIGVNASVVNDDGSHVRLVLGSKSSGVANAVTAIADSVGGGTLASLLGLSGMTFTPATRTAASISQTGFLQTDSGLLDAKFTLDGIAITRSSNVASDVLTGVTLTFQSLSASDVTVAVSVNNTQIQSNIQNFLTGYNAAISHIKSQTSVDPITYKRQIFAGNSTFSSLRSTLQVDVLREVPGLGSAPAALSAIGITLDRQGMLSITDTAKFNAAMAGDTSKLAQLFNSQDGIAVRFKNRLDAYVSAGGRMDASSTNSNSELASVTSRISRMSDQIDKKVLKYRDQFARLQSTLALVDQQMQQIQQLYTALGYI